EAESALRSAASAAALLRCAELEHRAVLALARCLFWQSRFEESVALLEPAISASGAADAYALAARVRAAMHDATRAVPAAAESVRRSQASAEPREIARAARAMTLARGALDDVEGACAAARVGLGAAAAGHLPLPALRIRAALYSALQRSSSSNLEARRLVAGLRAALRRPLSPLLARHLTAVCEDAECAGTTSRLTGGIVVSDLPRFLE